MIFKKNGFMDLLKEFAENDDSNLNSISSDIDTGDAQDIMDMIAEVDPEDVSQIMGGGINVENVRILQTGNGNCYVELAELIKLAEAESYDLKGSMESIFDHYPEIDQDKFFVTIPSTDMEKTIKEAAEGNQSAMHAIRDGSTLLRDVINKGLPIRKICDK